MKTTIKNSGFILLFATLAFITPNKAKAQQITSTLSETWGGSDWDAQSQSIYTYDDNDHLSSITTQQWDEPAGIWENAVRINYTNNTDGTVSQSIVQMWDEGAWVDTQRTTNTYTSFNELATSVSDLWTGAMWMPMLQSVYEYDSSEYLISATSQMFDFLSNNWMNTSRILYDNTPQGWVAVSTSQTWNLDTSTWSDLSRSNYVYTTSGKVLSVTDQDWSGTEWLNTQYITYSLTDKDEIVSATTQDWDLVSSTWVNSNLQLYTNNSQGWPIQIVSQSWQSGSWVNEGRITFTYSSLGIPDFSRGSISAYPVPVKETVTLALPEFSEGNYSIIDQSGRSIAAGKIDSGEQVIDMSTYASGIYYIKVAGHRTPVRIVKN